jgi:hypothetical protein
MIIAAYSGSSGFVQPELAARQTRHHHADQENTLVANNRSTNMSLPRFAVRNQKIAKTFSIAALTVLMSLAASAEQNGGETMTYRHFEVEDADGRVVRMTPVATTENPLWAREVRQKPFDWKTQSAGRNPVFLPLNPSTGTIINPISRGYPTGT